MWAGRWRVRGAEAAEAVARSLSRLTQYDEVEAAKHVVGKADAGLIHARQEFKLAKQRFEGVSARQMSHQQEMNALLHRKPQWTSAELSEFTDLCQVEHSINNDAQQAKRELVSTEDQVEAALNRYLNALREHYHQEQLWSEKGRRISTYGTMGLILFNSALFLLSVTVIEPAKREGVATRVAEKQQLVVEERLHEIEAEVARRLDRIDRGMQEVIAHRHEQRQAPKAVDAVQDNERTSQVTRGFIFSILVAATLTAWL